MFSAVDLDVFDAQARLVAVAAKCIQGLVHRIDDPLRSGCLLSPPRSCPGSTGADRYGGTDEARV